MKFSNQAIAALMMALQKSLLEQSDIVPVLKDFILLDTADGLVINNPPVVQIDNTQQTVLHHPV